MDHLSDMALYVEVVKARSFRRAAESLNMPNSTLSRRISSLEKKIGLRLLSRTTRKIELTEAGQLYFDRCKWIVEKAQLAHEELGAMAAKPSGVLRISLPVDFAITYLPPLLSEFANEYPDIEFELDLTPRNVDLISEPFDLAIRMAMTDLSTMGMSESSHLIARVLAKLPFRLYASPDYLERYGAPQHPSDLQSHQCLTMSNNGTWVLQSEVDMYKASVTGRFRGNSIGMLTRLCVHGIGIALLPEGIVAENVAAGRLRNILPEWQGPVTTVYAVTETRLLPAKSQRFIEFLKRRLKGA